KYCKQGHEQTPENVRVTNTKERGIRYLCRLCNLRKHPKGTPNFYEKSVTLHRNRIEDVEFLLDNEVRGKELVERSGYTRKYSLCRALKTANRYDLLDRI